MLKAPVPMDEANIAVKVDLLEQFLTRKEHLRTTHPLQYLFWESTLQCNLSCLHCGSDCVCDNSTKDNELSPERIIAELESIAEAYDPRTITLAIIGGEPLMRKDDILTVGRMAAEMGYNWGIVTNALLLDPQTVQDLQRAGLNTISISLDGLEQEHDALRRHPGAFRKTVEAIRCLLANPFYRKFDIICCVSTININSIPEFIEFLITLGVPAVRFTPVFFQGRAAGSPDLELSPDDHVRLFEIISRYREQENRISVTFSEEGYWGPAWEGRIRECLHYCASGILAGSILHNGDVIGCPSMSRELVEGNISERSFMEIWETCFHDIRHNREALFGPSCTGCEHWVLCEGGGLHLLKQKHRPRSACSLEKLPPVTAQGE